MKIYYLVFFCFIQVSSAQEKRIIDVKQILKDALEILRSTPPSPQLTEVGKMIMPRIPAQTQAQPQAQPRAQYSSYGPAAQPRLSLSADQIRLLQKIQANHPLTLEEYEQARHLNEYLKYETARRAQLYQQGKYPYRYPQQAPSMMSTINRIFAAPTDNDIQRLIMLPADIVYKMAQEGRYIEPDPPQNTYTEERESIANLGTDDTKKSENLFGNFNFNIQGGENPFLTTTLETPTEELTTTTATTTTTTTTTTTEKPVENTTTQKPIEETAAKAPEDPVQPFEIVTSHPDEQDRKNHHKPYFYYAKDRQGDDMGKWVLVVPPTENNESPKISVSELVELSRSLVKASQRSGMKSNMTELPPQLFQESQPVKEEKPIESNLPIASFVQEAESQTEEKSVTQSTPDEITIDGKVYKLVRDKSEKSKHTKNNLNVQATTSLPVVLKTAAPEDIKPAPVLSDLYRHLTPAEEKILLELQRRIIQQQKEEVAKIMTQQPRVPAVPNFILNGDSIEIPQHPQTPLTSSFVLNGESINIPQQTKVSSTPTLMLSGDSIRIPQQKPTSQQAFFNNYFGKLNPSVNSPQITTTLAPPKIQIHQITPSSELPMRKQYSLKELEEYYEAQKAIQAATQPPTPAPEVTTARVELTTPEKVYGPHRQVKIQMNAKNKLPPPTKTIQTTQVDSIADSADRERERIAELRRQFALERQQLSERLKSKINRSTVLERTTPAPSIVTEHHCYNIRSFARQSGAKSILEYAYSHCHYIENYYPDLKCENVKDYMDICKQYYLSRRMLFFI